jgi:hypothetical protein
MPNCILSEIGLGCFLAAQVEIIMSGEANPPKEGRGEERGNGEPAEDWGSSVGPPLMPTSIEIRREAVSQIVWVGLVGIDLFLVYIVYSQLNRPREKNYSPEEIIIYLAIVGAILAIALLVFRIAFRRYKGPPITIPIEDRKLLEELIRAENTKAIELYVRLSRLGGPTGTATKLGLTGLPLATIGLTIFFSIVALFVPGFLDLAKLTLGAFIGSFVQRSGEALERVVQRSTSASVAGEGLKP